jgi:predicted permease
MPSIVAGVLGQYRHGRTVFIITTLIVSLGVAATSSILTLAERLLLRPLPHPAPDRLIALRVQQADAPPTRDAAALFPESYLNLLELEATTSTFAHHGWYLSNSLQLGGGDQAVEITGGGVARDYFAVLGLPPALGRFPGAAELERLEPVAVVSHGFWQRQLGGAPGVIGQTLLLNGRAHTVAAVLPPRAAIPADADVLVPLEVTDRQKTERALRFIFHLGRLREGVTLEQAQADLDRAGAALLRQHPDTQQRWRLVATPFTPLFVDGQDRTVLILLGAATLLLLLAMLNLGSLVLAQAAHHSREIALRLAIGASARDVIGLALGRTLGLTLPGLGLGLLGAAWATPRLGALNPNPFLGHLYTGLELNPLTALATVGLVLLLALVAGLLPAWQNLSVESGHVLRETVRGGGASWRVLRAQRWLIRVQLALTSVFLVVGGLLGLSYQRLREVDQGFAVANRVAVTFTLPASRYGTEAPFRQLARALQDRLAEQPGLAQATVTTNLPVGDLVWSSNFATPPRDNAPAQFELHFFSRITETFLETAGHRLLRGRNLTRDDRADTMAVALVNDSFARRFWPGLDPVGQTVVRRRGAVISAPILVVGVISDAVVSGPRNAARPIIYLPVVQSTPNNALTVLAESPLAASEAIARVKAAVSAVDPALAVAYAAPMSERYENTVSVERFQAHLLAAMGVICLLITALGIYGMVERHVTAREVETVVRAALGAGPGEIVWLHAREQGLLVLSALLPGLIAAAAIAIKADLRLFGVTPLHPLPYLAAAGLVLGIVVLSMIWPLTRALRTPLAEVLRG